MRRIINSTYISLDGVIQDPQDWPSLGSGDGQGGAIQTELLLGCDALVMGRRTYESFAAVWPSRTGDPSSDWINSMPKYVFSSTLRNPEWSNTTVLSGDVAAEARRLKEQPGRDIVQYGFGETSYALMDAGLLDELRLWIHPFLIRRGGPDALLYREGPLTQFQLVDARPLSDGVVVLFYRTR